MIINNVIFNADLLEILEELRAQLVLNKIPYLAHIKDTPYNVMVSCPYHKGGMESKPSAGIKKSDGTFHCFACGEVHTLQEVISFCFGHTDDMIGAFGWQWLMKNFATVAIEERKDVRLDYRRDKGSRRSNIAQCDSNNRSNSDRDDIGFISEEELDSYRYYHPYWAKRKITEDWLFDLFDLGYDVSQKCITFPIRDEKGNCLFVARRSVKTKWFSYPVSVKKPLYGLYELSTLETFPQEVYVTESMLDCLYLWNCGRFSVAMNGTGTSLQFKQLSDMKCRKLILATDNDEAGKKARKTIRKNVKNKIITEVILPKGVKDINDCTIEQINNLEEVF